MVKVKWNKLGVWLMIGSLTVSIVAEAASLDGIPENNPIDRPPGQPNIPDPAVTPGGRRAGGGDGAAAAGTGPGVVHMQLLFGRTFSILRFVYLVLNTIFRRYFRCSNIQF